MATTRFIMAGAAGLAIAIGLSACAATVHTDTSPSQITGTISGVVERVGGPIGPDGTQPTPVPIFATAVIYDRAPGQASISGTPFETVTTSPANPGHFAITIKPGSYFVVARLTDGSIVSNPKRITVTEGATTSVELTVAVP